MIHVKMISLLGCLLTMTVLLSGCWNYREIEDLAIVSGFAIDKEDDKYILTSEIIHMKSGKDSEISTRLVSMEGTSLFDAARNTIKIAGKRLYFSHAEIVIVSKDIAEEGMVTVMDWIGRDTEPRYTLHILVSKEKSAKEILEKQTITADILSFELNDMLKAEKNLSNALEVNEVQFINELAGKGISAALPVVGLTTDTDKLVPEIAGTAVFKADKLVGFLDAEETKTLMFIKDRLKGGLLVQKVYKDNTPNNITLEIFENKTKVKPIYANGKFVMEISTNTDVAIAENGGRENFIDEDGQDKLKKEFEEMLETNIKNLVKKVQEQYGSDIFGFGKIIRKRIPNTWKQIESQWEQVFKDIDIEVHSIINIKNSALQSKPIKLGD